MFVPEEAESAYRAADVWKDFEEINPSTPLFTVTFVDVEGGNGEISSQTVLSGERATRPDQEPNRPGFAFMGWCIGSDIPESVCAVDWNFNAYVVTEDITLYARWEPASPRTVTFESSNDIWTINIEPQSVAYGGKVTRPTPDPEPLSQNFRFDGWYKEAECVNAWDFDVDVVTEDITLFAKWATTNSIQSADRDVSQVEEIVVVAPIDRATLSLTVGPNPVERQAGVVNLYLAGGQGEHAGSPLRGNLTIYDANGNVVRRLAVDDDVVTWDLRDSRGRLVVEGSYLVRGTITTSNSNRERVSAVLGVR